VTYDYVNFDVSDVLMGSILVVCGIYDFCLTLCYES